MVALAVTLNGALKPAASLDRLLAKMGDVAPGPERTLRASELLLGLPYELHPLGEGSGRDPKPRLRLNAFDCQTFIETALALGEARSAAEVRAALDDIRYAGSPSFAERNHFMMSQWIPSNRTKGYLAEPAATGAVAEKSITAGSWRARVTPGIVLPPERVPLGRFTLPLTSLDALLARGAEIPSGTLLLVVRADRPSFPDRVTHLGFVVQHGGRTFFRHASDVFERVVDEPIERFVARNRRYAYPVAGVSLLSIEDNSARVARLAAAKP